MPKRLSAVPKPEDPSPSLEEQARARPSLWPVLHQSGFNPGIGLWSVPENATVIDWAYAIDPFQAKHLAGAKVNGRKVPLTRRLKPDDLVELFTSPESSPQQTWVEAAGTPARQLILHQLHMIGRHDDARHVVETAFHNIVHRKPEKQKLFAFKAADEVPARGSRQYVQPNREGKKLIGAYVAVEDIAKLKAILQARGTTVQDYFGQIVANEIAAAGKPGELEKLIEAQLDRFRATLRPTLKK